MAAAGADDEPVKRLKDYGAARIISGHKTKRPLKSVELLQLYLSYLGPKNKTKVMDDQEFELFCRDFKKLLPKSKNEKLRGTGYLALKEDLMMTFKNSRARFNEKNKNLVRRLQGLQHGGKNDPACYEIKLKDDEIGLEELGRIVCVEPNFLLRPELRRYFTGGSECMIPKEVCDKVFSHYDENGNAWLGQTEITALLRDIFAIQRVKEEMTGRPVSAPKEIAELMEYTDEMCIKFSTNLDGMLTFAELELLLNQTKK